MTGQAETYEIEVRGHLDRHWTSWFGEVELTHHPDRTTGIRTTPVDQAQLHGLLAQLRDLGVPVTMLRTTTQGAFDVPAAALARPLTTQRLTLRAAVPDDADSTWQYRSRPDVAEWLTALPSNRDDYRHTFADAERLSATVIIEHEGDVAGDFMLQVEDSWAQTEVRDHARRTRAEIGWTLHPTFSGRGLATEAATALIDHCFTTLGVRRVVASTFADNHASIRLIERLGLRLEEHSVRESLHRSGRWLDTCRYALLSDEWSPSRASPAGESAHRR